MLSPKNLMGDWSFDARSILPPPVTPDAAPYPYDHTWPEHIGVASPSTCNSLASTVAAPK